MERIMGKSRSKKDSVDDSLGEILIHGGSKLNLGCRGENWPCVLSLPVKKMDVFECTGMFLKKNEYSK